MNFENTAFIFPGQGSQHLGMGAEFMENSASRELFERAEDTLKFNLSKLMQGDDFAELTKTENAQPALFLASMLAVEYLLRQTGKTVAELSKFVAGHSLGEYTAVCATGCLDFETTLKLVRARGQAMATAQGGGMAAVLGLDKSTVSGICAQTKVTLANDNSPKQQVISGNIKAVEQACTLLKTAGAKRVVPLEVTGAFHTSAMLPAGKVVADRLKTAEITSPAVPVVMNVSAQAEVNPKIISTNLVAQITNSVRWRETMEFMAQNNINNVVELGAGKVLTGLAKRQAIPVKGVALNTPKQIDEWLEANI